MRRILFVLLIFTVIFAGCAPLQEEEQEQPEQQDTQETQAHIIDVEEKLLDGPQTPTSLSVESLSGSSYVVTLGGLSYTIELEPNMYIEYDIIHDDVLLDYFGMTINRKVGEICDYSTFENEQELAGYLSSVDYDSSEGWINKPPEVIVKSDSYQTDSGRNIYYCITKIILDDTGIDVWNYVYAIPLGDNVAVWVVLWGYEDNRNADEPRFRAIVDSVELA